MSDQAFVQAARDMGRMVALMNLRGDYVHGRIDIEEFERRVGIVLGTECRHEWIDVTSFGAQASRICSICGERQEA